MQRTDWAEVYLEKFSSIPLTWENVFRSTEYFNKTVKEVIDLLLVLRNEGIFISMKCQQNPQKRRGNKLISWVNKSAQGALRQVKGGIKTSQTRDYWCEHPRRGKVPFKPKEIQITHTVIIVETFDVVKLSNEFPLEVDSIPISYFSVNDFFNIIKELRTIKDIQRYLSSRKSFSKEILTTLGLEKTIYEYFILHNGVFPEGTYLSQLAKEVKDNKKQINERIRIKHEMDKNTYIIEKVSDALSKRHEDPENGLDQDILIKYDAPSNRKNYLLIQNELCDLVLDERRQMGSCFSEIMENVNNDAGQKSMGYRSISLDSKPDFQYVLLASKSIERNEIIKLSEVLIKAALSEYSKERGLIISYNQDNDNFEMILVNKFKNTKIDMEMGKKFFAKLQVEDIPVEAI